MTMIRILLALTVILALTLPALPVAAQDSAESDSTVAWPEPRPEDVESIDAIIKAVYAVISGPASEERDWDRFMSMFLPEARLVPTAVRPDSSIAVVPLSPQEYAERAGPFFTLPGGFFEVEIGRKTDIYGHIAQVFSAYASYREGEDEPFMRGINSFQLVNLGDRWAVVTIFWQQETDDNPIPDDMIYEQ